MNLKQNKLLKFLVVGLVVVASEIMALNNSKSVQAAYGNIGKYTMPVKMHGTWISKDKKSVYKKIKITKNTMWLYKKSKIQKWNLRKVSQKWMDKASMRTRVKSFSYAQKHRYMTVRKDKNNYVFNFGWGVPCNDGDFVLTSESNNIFKFSNVIHVNDFYRVKG